MDKVEDIIYSTHGYNGQYAMQCAIAHATKQIRQQIGRECSEAIGHHWMVDGDWSLNDVLGVIREVCQLEEE